MLAAVLGWAAVAKAVRREAVAASFRGLRLPAPRVLAVAVPATEAGVATGLVVRPRAGAWAALGLLLVFTIVIARAMAEGVQAGCACFGAGSAGRPVSGVDLVRNAALAGLAILATAAPASVVP